jgi:hypothetical protein
MVNIMNVSKVNSPANVNAETLEAKEVANEKTNNEKLNTEKQITQKKNEQDTLYISEKAKDLAAKQEGKAIQEEQKESQTAKMKEMSGI